MHYIGEINTGVPPGLGGGNSDFGGGECWGLYKSLEMYNNVNQLLKLSKLC